MPVSNSDIINAIHPNLPEAPFLSFRIAGCYSVCNIIINDPKLHFLGIAYSLAPRRSCSDMADPPCMTVALVSMEHNGTLLEARHPPCYGPYYTLVGEIALPGNPDEG